jgi:hypothetical protein
VAIFIITLISLFIIFFIVATVIVALRYINTYKKMDQEGKKKVLEAKITQTSNDINNIIFLADFVSPASRINFNKRFVLSKKHFNEEDFTENKTINLVYPEVDEEKQSKVLYFPLLVEGQKRPYNYQFLLGAGSLIVATIALLVFLISTFSKNNMFDKGIGEVWEFLVSKSQFLVVLVIMGFFVAMQAMLTILISPSRDTLYDYLKVYGVKAKARVKTYKYGRAKSEGMKECHLEIEYTTFEGEKIETRLSSFLYFQTQEEYIDILYAPQDPKNVVYLRK